LNASFEILLVEDDHLILEIAQDALEHAGYRVHVAKCGVDALDLMSRLSTDLAGLVTDIRLGEGPNGWELARHARRTHPEIAVVYMTGDSAGDWRREGVAHSVVMQKPFVMARIVTALTTLLTRPDIMTVRPADRQAACDVLREAK